jgi:hypothetical protein
MMNFYCSEKHDKRNKHGEGHADHEEAQAFCLFSNCLFSNLAVDPLPSVLGFTTHPPAVCGPFFDMLSSSSLSLAKVLQRLVCFVLLLKTIKIQ